MIHCQSEDENRPFLPDRKCSRITDYCFSGRCEGENIKNKIVNDPFASVTLPADIKSVVIEQG